MPRTISLIDDLRRRFDSLMSVDIDVLKPHGQIDEDTVSAENMFPAQLTWTLAEVVRQLDLVETVVNENRPTIEQFMQSKNWDDAHEWNVHLLDGSQFHLRLSYEHDGVLLRLMNHTTGEVMYVDEAMPLQFDPARVGWYRKSPHAGGWDSAAGRYFEMVASTNDCFAACAILAEIGLLERDLLGYAPTDLLDENAIWFRSLSEVWNDGDENAQIAAAIGDWDYCGSFSDVKQRQTTSRRNILAQGLWSLLKSCADARQITAITDPEIGDAVEKADWKRKGGQNRRMPAIFNSVHSKSNMLIDSASRKPLSSEIT